jgi:hypothetical protein
VVLVNRNSVDVSAAVGFLKLPTGFEPAGTSTIPPEAKTIMTMDRTHIGLRDPAMATHHSIISAQSPFTLYFEINVVDEAIIGTHSA